MSDRPERIAAAEVGPDAGGSDGDRPGAVSGELAHGHELRRRTRVVRFVSRKSRKVMGKVFPAHWSFLLGEITLISFFVLVGTGLYLTLFYEASGEMVVYDGAYEPLVGVEMSAAYRSVLDITFEVPAGVVVRQVHHWAALVFLGAMVAHAMRVFFTGAYRRPRRLNWMIGLTMMGLAMANGFFGLGLPGDLLGGTGLRIGHAFATSIPLIGPGAADLVFGGAFPAEGMYHRLWQLHVIILPIAIGVLLAGHLALVFLQTHTQFRFEGRPSKVVGASGWPGYAIKTAGLVTIVIGFLVLLGSTIEIAAIWLYGPFDPANVTVPAQPDWYLGWVEGALRIFPALEVQLFGGEIPSQFFAGILMPIVVFAFLYAWPFFDEWVTGDRRDHHAAERLRDHPVRTGVGFGGLAFLGVLLAAGSHDLQALLVDVPLEQVTNFYRVLIVVVPPVVGLVAWKVSRDLRRGTAVADTTIEEVAHAEAEAKTEVRV